MSTETKFENFWAALEQCPYDLPVEIKPHLLIALKGSGFFDVPTQTVSGGTTVTKTKKLSGYNVFMKEKMAEFKAQNVPSGERMSKVGALWKTLSEEEKGVWKSKAAQVEPVTVTVTASAPKSTGPKKLSGYQLYVKETMPIVKVKAEIPAKERMAEIGKMWKALKDEEKAAFKVKAEQLI